MTYASLSTIARAITGTA
jgi:hypothetical protein